MKKLLIGLLTLGSISAFAVDFSDECQSRHERCVTISISEYSVFDILSRMNERQKCLEKTLKCEKRNLANDLSGDNKLKYCKVSKELCLIVDRNRGISTAYKRRKCRADYKLCKK